MSLEDLELWQERLLAMNNPADNPLGIDEEDEEKDGDADSWDSPIVQKAKAAKAGTTA